MSKTFSQRMGIVPVKSVIQVNSMDAALRTSLWNVLTLHFWDQLVHMAGPIKKQSAGLWEFLRLAWRDFFKQPVDDVPRYWDSAHDALRQWFFSAAWMEVYDFVEFAAQNYPYEVIKREFVTECNAVLERELSAYRFVGNQLIPITSEQEIQAIEQTMLDTGTSQALAPVREHLDQALDLLADRTNPDYRNSMKESISAVEAMGKIITGDANATLGAALNAIQRYKRLELHPALKDAFTKLYGYTSAADGIRHGLIDESNLDAEDAVFMLVTCSAFVSYLTAKASKAGVVL